MTLRLAFLLSVSLVALGCREVTGNTLHPAEATVRFVDIEGGCWTIVHDQRVYSPLDLPAEFRRDGLRVRVIFERRDDYGSICMVGPIVQLLSIESL